MDQTGNSRNNLESDGRIGNFDAYFSPNFSYSHKILRNAVLKEHRAACIGEKLSIVSQKNANSLK